MPTGIEYVDETYNPVTGCTKMSPGCENCYAERMARRLAGRFGYPEAPRHFDVTLHPGRLEEPLKWRRDARILLPSMGDLFHEDVPDDFITSVLGITAISSAPFYTHTYLLLTKRPERMREYAEQHEPLWAVASIWPGVTAENQATADERIPILLGIPAAKHWVSLEPMLGPIDMHKFLLARTITDFRVDEVSLMPTGNFELGGAVVESMRVEPRLDWVVLGGETGPGARPMHPEWVRRVKDDCLVARTDFFFKGHGAWVHESQTHWEWSGVGSKNRITAADGSVSFRVGKKAAGRLLDGREWNEMPEEK